MLHDHKLLPRDGGAPKKIVIFLHGLGDRGDGGLLSICDMWRAHLPDCAFFCPDAPFDFDMAPGMGRQWFSLATRSPDTILAGVTTAEPILNDYINAIIKSYNIGAEHIALAGFSQGTMMALWHGLQRADGVAGILGYSGFLPPMTENAKSTPPIFLSHGMADDVVPYRLMEESAVALRAKGCVVESLARPALPHSIDEVGIEAGLNFIRKVLY